MRSGCARTSPSASFVVAAGVAGELEATGADVDGDGGGDVEVEETGAGSVVAGGAA